MPPPTEQQLNFAHRLLFAPPTRPEDNIRQDLGRLLDSFDIENIITYRTPGGPADLYLPRRRIVIETKTAGFADDPHQPQARENPETPFQQVERYLTSELRSEKEQLPLDRVPDLRWTAILTDGRVWHAWLYDHDLEAVARHVLDNFRPRDPGELLNRLLPIFNTAPVGKPWIPSDPRPIFEPAHTELRTIYEALTGQRLAETQTRSKLWLEMLRTANMEPESDAARIQLFVTHSFLVALARGVIHTLADPGTDPDPAAILGDGFVSWILSTSRGRNWARALLDEIHRHEWRRRRGDVLRPLYESVVGDRDRQAFGEYYTPDWLAALMVDQVLDDAWCEDSIAAAIEAERNHRPLRGIGMIDPACGSGTFLYHAAQRLLASPILAEFPAPRRAGAVARLVTGIDVHPVAAEISRATLLRALPTEPPDGKASLRIYEGDSLLVNADDETSLFRPQNGEIRITTPRGAEVLLPRSFIELPTFDDSLRRLIDAAAGKRPLPLDIPASVPPEDRDAINACYESFVCIVQREGNAVWTWYIANTTGPLRLTDHKVNRIVANPPWVSMAHIQAETRKRALEEFADRDLELWTGGKNAPHFDTAQLFIRRARELYLADPASDPGAWLVKRSALSSGAWARFRDWHRPILTQSLDLDSIQPFGGGDARRSCVLFEVRPSSLVPDTHPARIEAIHTGRRPRPDNTLLEAQPLLRFQASPPRLSREPSAFLDDNNTPLFRQGATITPKVLTVAASVTASADPDRRTVTTARSNKEPWNAINPVTGEVPAHWVRRLLTSNELLAFAVLPDLPQAIVPTDARGRLLGDPAAQSAFWGELDDYYSEHRGQGRNTPKTLIGRIDYLRQVAAQLQPLRIHKTLVLHPTSGDIMRAARIAPGTAILQHTIHYLRARSPDEAAFLVALLNAPRLNHAFLQSRTSGRHFTNNPWRAVPIPRYDKTDRSHRRLAALCKRAEQAAEEWISEQTRPFGQAAASTRIRRLLTEGQILASIDDAAAQILPDHIQ